MNERIQELEKQCWTHITDGLLPWQLHFDAEKFAKLIVLECIEVMKQNDYYGEWSGERKRIKQHFGVEE